MSIKFYQKKQNKIKQKKAMASSLHEDDGVDPRHYFRHKPNKKDRKTRQLCCQIARQLNAILGELSDDLLSTCYIEEVVPAPDISRCMVTFVWMGDLDAFEPQRLLERIGQVQGMFRGELAMAIHRRRVPQLSFRVIPKEEVCA